MKRVINPIIFNLLLLICLLQTGLVAAVEIKASVSRNKVAVNESFQLTFRAEENPSGEPDFTPLLTDFEILNQNQSHNIHMVNGNVRRSISWNLTLIASAPGTREIPSISFGNDMSNPLTVKILESGPVDNRKTGDDLFLKLEIEPETAYVQQQILLRVRLYHAVMLGDASISPPAADDSNTIIQRMGQDVQFETMVDGRRYKVTERRYALFPQKSGTLGIKPVIFQGEVFPASGSSSDLFLSPYRRFGQRGQIRRLKTEPVSVLIKSIPTTIGNTPWLPSDNFQLEEEWPQQAVVVKAGEPVTRTFKLQAYGLTSAQLPPINAVLPASMKQYSDQPLLRDLDGEQGVIGIRQEKIAIVPTKPGEFIIPAIEIPWWNTATNKPAIARVPERKILVQANPLRNSDRATDEKDKTSKTDRTTTRKDENSSPQTIDPIATQMSGSFWPWLLALVLGMGWLLTAIFGGRRNKHEWKSPNIEKRPTVEKPQERSVTLKDVKRSCIRGYPEGAAIALLQWAKQQWPESPPRSLGALARYLGGDVANEIGMLEKILYSPAAETDEWHGENLWSALETELDNSPDTSEDEHLAPLHPT